MTLLGIFSLHDVPSGSIARLFQQKVFDTASQCFSASARLLPGEDAANQSKTARMTGMCYMGCKEYARADAMFQRAEEIEPDNVNTAFLRFKADLEANHLEAAKGQIQKMVRTIYPIATGLKAPAAQRSVLISAIHSSAQCITLIN